jgi:hypothetical protein
MTMDKLIRNLQKLVAEDSLRDGAVVTFGSDMEPLLGAIVTRHPSTGLVALNLPPIRLDRLGSC